jgi:hypothetical protein
MDSMLVLRLKPLLLPLFLWAQGRDWKGRGAQADEDLASLSAQSIQSILLDHNIGSCLGMVGSKESKSDIR